MFEFEFQEGYSAFMGWQKSGGLKPANPYDEDAQPVEFTSWEKGFQTAMEDS